MKKIVSKCKIDFSECILVETKDRNIMIMGEKVEGEIRLGFLSENKVTKKILGIGPDKEEYNTYVKEFKNEIQLLNL